MFGFRLSSRTPDSRIGSVAEGSIALGLRAKIVVNIVLPLAILLVIFTLLDLRSSRNQAIKAEAAALESRIRNSATQLDGLLLRMAQIAETSAIAIRDRTEWSDADLRDFGSRLVDSDADLFGFAVAWGQEASDFQVMYRADNKVDVEHREALVLPGVKPLFKRARDGLTPFWAGPHDAEGLSGFDAAARLSPVISSRGFEGAVAVILDPASFRRLAARIGLAESPWLIVSEEGIVIAAGELATARLVSDGNLRGRDLFEVLGRQGVLASEIEALQENLNDQDVFVQISAEGKSGDAPRVAAIARLQETSWFLISGESIEVVVGPAYEAVAQRSISDLLLIILAVVIVQIGAWFTVLRPIRRIVSFVHRTAAGDRGIKADLPGNDEIALLGRTLDEAMPRLDELAATRAAVENARLIQESLVPETPCSGRRIVVAGRVEPCDEVGGDYFDHDAFDDGRTLFSLGDATGHGLPAAILIATARAYVRSAMRSDAPAAAAMTDANQRLFEDSPAGLFVVLVHARFDGVQGELEIVSAGHPCWIRRKEDSVYRVIDATGIPLGISSNRYESRQLEGLEPGDLVLFASDGAWEVRNDDGEMLGIDALLARAGEISHLDPLEQVNELFRQIHDFAGERPLDDDCTIVIARIEAR